MKIDFQDRIDDYLLDRMSDGERKRFESDIANNPELEEQLKFTKTIHQATKSRNEKLIKIKKWRDDYIREGRNASVGNYIATGTDDYYCEPTQVTRHKQHTDSRKITYWLSGIAAIAIIGVFFVKIRLTLLPTTISENNSGIELPTTQYGNSNVTFRGSIYQQTIDRLLAEGDYEGALKQIKADEDYLRKQIENLSQKDDSTINIVEKREILKYKLEQVLWLKVQTLLGLNRNDEAIILLNDIRHSESEYSIQADSLYNALKE